MRFVCERSIVLRDNNSTVLTSSGPLRLLVIPSLRVDHSTNCWLKLTKYDLTLLRDAQIRRKWIAKFTGDGPAWVAGCDRTVSPKEWKRDVLVNVYEVGRRRVSMIPAVLRLREDGRCCCDVS